ncbi:MAG: methyltransferase domain-containing protein [Phycisphaerales bacterium]|jgi:SAM-dependent methyltransferase|nr:methyltransferase domain-containing protein [Phycisphaerales bacterium]MBT7170152.1 methyltransferase domain-containing protein [Phycisphaerales bacterium]
MAMKDWIIDLEFERISAPIKVLKKCIINPLANYLPAGLLKAWLRAGKSELALENWKDPGGWRSMVISYNADPKQSIDRMLIKSGAIPMALRNRRKLAARLMARLIDLVPTPPAQVLCLGAGPGHIVSDAMLEARHDSRATLVDISSDAFDYGRQLAEDKGLTERMTFIQGDVRDVHDQLPPHVDLVKMIGICEYLETPQIAAIAESLAEVMPAGSSVVFNSISPLHGTDRFFRRVLGLNMIYRTPADLQAIFAAHGFGEFETFAEPLGVYNVVVAKRLGGAE